MDKDFSEVHDVANRMYLLTGKLIEEGEKPFAIAAIYIMIAMQIYRTMLSDKDYHKMVDMISDSRDQVKTLPEIVRGTLN